MPFPSCERHRVFLERLGLVDIPGFALLCFSFCGTSETVRRFAESSPSFDPSCVCLPSRQHGHGSDARLEQAGAHTFKRTRHGKQPRQFLQTPRTLARHAPAASFASAQFKASTQISVVPLWSSMISCDSTMVSFTVLHCLARGLHQRRCRRNRATIEHANVYERFGEGGPVPYAESAKSAASLPRRPSRFPSRM